MLEGNDANIETGYIQTAQTDVSSDVNSDLHPKDEEFDISHDIGNQGVQNTVDTKATEQVQETIGDNTEPQTNNSDTVNAEILLDVALQDPEVAKRLLSNPSFVAFAQSNPNLAEKLQSIQLQTAQQEPIQTQPQDPLFDIARQAAQQANQIYKQMTGNEFDPVLATPEERAYYDLLQKQAMDKLYSDYQQQVQIQQQQQIAEQTLQVVNSLAAQKFGQDFLNQLQNIINSLPYGEYQKLDQEFTAAVASGDINKALAIYEQLRARQVNSQTAKQTTPINNVEPATANNIVPQQANPADALNEELLKLAEEEF